MRKTITLLSTARPLTGVKSLKQFLDLSQPSLVSNIVPNVEGINNAIRLKFYIETYGCQMNVADSDVIRSVLLSAGHVSCVKLEDADIILTNTCAIRENAEEKVWNRLDYFQSIRNNNRKLHIRKAGYPMVSYYSYIIRVIMFYIF